MRCTPRLAGASPDIGSRDASMMSRFPIQLFILSLLRNVTVGINQASRSVFQSAYCRHLAETLIKNPNLIFYRGTHLPQDRQLNERELIFGPSINVKARHSIDWASVGPFAMKIETGHIPLSVPWRVPWRTPTAARWIGCWAMTMMSPLPKQPEHSDRGTECSANRDPQQELPREFRSLGYTHHIGTKAAAASRVNVPIAKARSTHGLLDGPIICPHSGNEINYKLLRSTTYRTKDCSRDATSQSSWCIPPPCLPFRVSSRCVHSGTISTSNFHIWQLSTVRTGSLVPEAIGMLPFNEQFAGTLAVAAIMVTVLGLLWLGDALH